MTNTDQINSAHDNYLKLPRHIKDWLSSEQLVHEVEIVAEKFNLGPKDVSGMIRVTMMMIFGEILPANFLNELSHGLNISPQSAKMLGEEIINYMRPIENDLRRDLGLDIKLIRVGQSTLGKTNEQPAPYQSGFSGDQTNSGPNKSTIRPAVQQQGPVVNLQSFQIRSDRPLSPLTFAPAMKEEKVVAAPPTDPSAGSTSSPQASSGREKEPESHPTPFMLHQENPTLAPSINSAPKEFQTSKSSLTMKVQNFYQSSASEKSVPKPISIKVETSLPGTDAQKSGQSINITKQDSPPVPKPDLPQTSPLPTNESQESRVVHYSNLRTPINSVGLPKNVVEKDNILDLRKKV